MNPHIKEFPLNILTPFLIVTWLLMLLFFLHKESKEGKDYKLSNKLLGFGVMVVNLVTLLTYCFIHSLFLIPFTSLAIFYRNPLIESATHKVSAFVLNSVTLLRYCFIPSLILIPLTFFAIFNPYFAIFKHYTKNGPNAKNKLT